MEKVIFKFMVFISGVLLMTSCVVEQEIRFNEDYSGTVTTTIQLGDMLAGMEAEESDATLKQMEDSLSQTDQFGLNKMEGISNFRTRIDRESKALIMQYDFADIDALNRGMSGLSTDEMPMTTARVTQRRRKIIYELDGAGADAGADSLASAFGEMESMISFRTTIIVPGTVKKVKSKHLVQYEGSAVFWDREMSDDELKVVIKVK